MDELRKEKIIVFRNLYKPKIVVTYGKDIFNLNNNCHGVGFSKENGKYLAKYPYTVDKDKNIIMHCPHPNTKGLKNTVFDDIGKLIYMLR